MVCFFLITLAPPCLGALLTAVGDYPPAEVHKVAPYFIFSGSLVNPIIYGIINPQFRDAFKKYSIVVHVATIIQIRPMQELQR